MVVTDPHIQHATCNPSRRGVQRLSRLHQVPDASKGPEGIVSSTGLSRSRGPPSFGYLLAESAMAVSIICLRWLMGARLSECRVCRLRLLGSMDA